MEITWLNGPGEERSERHEEDGMEMKEKETHEGVNGPFAFTPT